MFHREQERKILDDLDKKIVLLAGPRQVGKTFLAREILAQSKKDHCVYLNYDHIGDRKIIEEESWLNTTTLLILDELHKMPHWTRYLKGLYDTKPSHLKILVTGSARIDQLRIGESLAGRFFRHRLLPFSPKELSGTRYENDIARLIRRGGFPEPLFAETDEDADRWRQQYIDGMLRHDVWEIASVQDLKKLHLTFQLLQQKVGSPISYSSLAEDVQTSPNTIKKYIDILEALYIVFKIQPFSKNIARSLMKEPKVYFFDTGLVANDVGARFENMMAVCLLKHIWGLVDEKGQDRGLYYLKTKDGEEVDFCLTHQGNPQLMIESKNADAQLSKHLTKFHQRYNIPGKQVVLNLKHEYQQNGLELRRAQTFLSELFH